MDTPLFWLQPESVVTSWIQVQVSIGLLFRACSLIIGSGGVSNE